MTRYTDEQRKLFYSVRHAFSASSVDDLFGSNTSGCSMSRAECREIRAYQRQRRLDRLSAQVARDLDMSDRLPLVVFPDFPDPHTPELIEARRSVKEYIADFVIIANTPCQNCACPLLAVVHGSRRCICCNPLDEWLPYLPAIHEIVAPLVEGDDTDE